MKAASKAKLRGVFTGSDVTWDRYPCQASQCENVASHRGVTNNQAVKPFDETSGLVSLRRVFDAVSAIEFFRDIDCVFCNGNYLLNA